MIISLNKFKKTGGESTGGDTPNYRYMNGTIDKAGLKAIGWTDEDILTYEQNNPHYPWQNDLFKVSDENKELYLLDDPNSSSYKDNPNIVFVPNKNMESYFAKSSGFDKMKYIKGIPFYDTSSVTDARFMFNDCSSLTSIPPLDLSSVTYALYLFCGCSSLTSIPPLDLSSVTNTQYMFSHCSRLTSIPPLDLSSVTDAQSIFDNCSSLTIIPQLNFSSVINAQSMFGGCSRLTTIPPLDLSSATNASFLFNSCTSLTTVEGIDFSGLTSDLTQLFGYNSSKPKLTRFIVNGKINVSISDNFSIRALTAIDYDSVKSILAAADRTDNTNAKTLAFNRTMTDQNGELAALVTSCTSKGWIITGLTIE